MFDASQQCGNGTSTRSKYKNESFRPMQNISNASHASINMEKLSMDVEKCGVSDLILTQPIYMNVIKSDNF